MYVAMYVPRDYAFFILRARFVFLRIVTVIQTVRGQNLREFLVIKAIQLYKHDSSVILVQLLFSLSNRQVRI
jgi:hypothetical protein